MPRKIIISINTAWNIVNFRAGLVRSLKEQGFDVLAVAPDDGYATRLEEIGCRHVPLAMNNKGTNPTQDAALFLRYLALLRRERPDVYLGWTIKPNVYGSLAAHGLGIPVVNNVSGLGTAFIRESWLTRIVQHLYRTAFRRSARVFFQNGEDRDLFVRLGLVRDGQTGLLPGSGIDLERFAPAAPVPRPPGEGPVFVLIARLLWDKGVGEYVEAARQVRATCPSARFRLLGFLDVVNRTAVPRETVEGWVREGLIDYLGASDDVRPHIADADCVVLPSYREGAPRSLLEAAAMAKPVITTDVPGCRDVMTDTVTGLLCQPRDADDLAARMRSFAAMTPAERSAMGAAGRAKMEREFDEKIVIDRYLEIIDALLSAQPV